MLKRRLFAPLAICFTLVVAEAARAEDDTPASSRHVIAASSERCVSRNEATSGSASALSPHDFSARSAVPSASHQSANAAVSPRPVLAASSELSASRNEATSGSASARSPHDFPAHSAVPNASHQSNAPRNGARYANSDIGPTGFSAPLAPSESIRSPLRENGFPQGRSVIPPKS